MKYYSIGEFAQLIGVTQQTLRNWDKVRKLIVVSYKVGEPIKLKR